MRNISVLGIDIAKHVFYLHGVDNRGECILRKKVSRSKLLGEIEELPRSCKIAMESCGSSHHWGRVFFWILDGTGLLFLDGTGLLFWMVPGYFFKQQSLLNSDIAI